MQLPVVLKMHYWIQVEQELCSSSFLSKRSNSNSRSISTSTRTTFAHDNNCISRIPRWIHSRQQRAAIPNSDRGLPSPLSYKVRNRISSAAVPWVISSHSFSSSLPIHIKFTMAEFLPKITTRTGNLKRIVCRVSSTQGVRDVESAQLITIWVHHSRVQRWEGAHRRTTIWPSWATSFRTRMRLTKV